MRFWHQNRAWYLVWVHFVWMGKAQRSLTHVQCCVPPQRARPGGPVLSLVLSLRVWEAGFSSYVVPWMGLRSGATMMRNFLLPKYLNWFGVSCIIATAKHSRSCVILKVTNVYSLRPYPFFTTHEPKNVATFVTTVTGQSLT